jgi:hypothetical protein
MKCLKMTTFVCTVAGVLALLGGAVTVALVLIGFGMLGLTAAALASGAVNAPAL